MFELILLGAVLFCFGLVIQGFTRLIKSQDKQIQLLEKILAKLDEQ